jgi:hypothetical protein
MEPEELFSTFYKHLALAHQIGELFKIPPISHHFWLTNPANSKEAREEDIQNLKNTISILDDNSVTKWNHIFWTNCKVCIPYTVEKLAPINIEIKELSTIQSSLITYKTVIDLINKNDFGKAADLIREDVVNIMGGFYSDLNYIIYKSPEALMKQFNFFADAVGGISVENYMFASSPYHPILNDAITSTLNLLKDPGQTLDIDITGCTDEDLTHSLTYGSFVSAFMKNANKYNTIDLALPLREEEPGDLEDSWESHSIITNIDGTVVEVYGYPSCSPKEEDISPLAAHFEKYITYFNDHMQCTQASFGEDGRNGGTWHDYNQVQQIDEMYAPEDAVSLQFI